MNIPTTITIKTSIAASIDDVWSAFNDPQHILQWDTSDDWLTTHVSNDLRIGGKLILTIKGNNEPAQFTVAATYTKLEPKSLIEFSMDDDQTLNRMVQMQFLITDIGVMVIQTFDIDTTLSIDKQRSDWQNVQNRFAQYVESIAN